MNDYKTSEMINCCSEDVEFIAIVVAELKLRDIEMEIFLADLVVCCDNTALQDRTEALNRIGVNCANDMLADCVVNELMRETELQTAMAGVSVGQSRLTRFEMVSRTKASSVSRSVLSTTRATTFPLRLKVAREPLHLPVAIARWVEAAAAIEFWRGGRLGFGAPRLRFGERPPRRRLEIASGRLVGVGADA
jgi:hypothetical protein